MCCRTRAQNFGKYCSDAVEKAAHTSAAAVVSDFVKRIEFYAQAADQWMTDLPVIYFYHEKRFFGLASWIEGFVAVQDGIIQVANVTKAE